MTIDVGELIERCAFDENDQDRATAWLCGTFALALHSVVEQGRLAFLCYIGRDGEVLTAKDGQPMWRHAVLMLGDHIFDIEGEVQLEHIIDNYCWDNPTGSGGKLVPVSKQRMETILKSDNKSYDERYWREWVERLSRVRFETESTPSFTFSAT